MAEDTTPKTTQATDNSKPISAMPELTTAQGSTLVPVVDGGNKKVKLSTIKSYINEGMVAQQTGKGLSTNDFTNALKAKLDSLSNYDDAQLRQAVNALKGEIDTILGDGATSAIDTFNEIEAFLTGITDTQTLTGLLQQLKSTITGETDGKLANKVDKVSGKGLSANDYTNEEKAAVATIGNKVDKVSGKGLSANDYTNDDKAKLGKLLPNEQFGQNGIFILSTDGTGKNDSNYCASGFMPINRQYPIIANVYSTINSSAIALFDATYKFIGALSFGVNTIGGTKDGNIYTLPAAAIPQNAVYFRVGTNKAMLQNSYYSNGPTMESREGAISDAIQASITAAVDEALIARAKACGVVYNAKTGYFSHNGIDDLTAAEVSDMLAHVNEIFLPGARRLQTLKARTNIVTASSFPKGWNADFANLDGVCEGNQYIEVLKIGDCQVSKESQLVCIGYQCPKLRKVLGVLDMLSVTHCRDQFSYAFRLEEVALYGLRISISFKDCPLLSLATLQYLVNNAANTGAITVTVHPTVYAKLTDESNAEWNAVLTAAEAKQIEFATTE